MSIYNTTQQQMTMQTRLLATPRFFSPSLHVSPNNHGTEMWQRNCLANYLPELFFQENDIFFHSFTHFAHLANQMDTSALEKKVSEQGVVVRNLKQQKASQEQITEAVNTLLAYKAELKEAQQVAVANLIEEIEKLKLENADETVIASKQKEVEDLQNKINPPKEAKKPKEKKVCPALQGPMPLSLGAGTQQEGVEKAQESWEHQRAEERGRHRRRQRHLRWSPPHPVRQEDRSCLDRVCFVAAAPCLDSPTSRARSTRTSGSVVVPTTSTTRASAASSSSVSPTTPSRYALLPRSHRPSAPSSSPRRPPRRWSTTPVRSPRNPSSMSTVRSLPSPTPSSPPPSRTSRSASRRSSSSPESTSSSPSRSMLPPAPRRRSSRTRLSLRIREPSPPSFLIPSSITDGSTFVPLPTRYVLALPPHSLGHFPYSVRCLPALQRVLVLQGILWDPQPQDQPRHLWGWLRGLQVRRSPLCDGSVGWTTSVLLAVLLSLLSSTSRCLLLAVTSRESLKYALPSLLIL